MHASFVTHERDVPPTILFSEMDKNTVFSKKNCLTKIAFL